LAVNPDSAFAASGFRRTAGNKLLLKGQPILFILPDHLNLRSPQRHFGKRHAILPVYLILVVHNGPHFPAIGWFHAHFT
jgi:hypothetical protein